MQYGYTGKTAWVDLTTKTVQVRDLEETVVEKYLGGKGLGAYLLFKHLKPGTAPLDPANLLMFVTGPLTGTAFPAVARSAVVTKSPLTGTIVDSYSGSYFGPQLKYAGYDALIISGKAEKPSYLLIDDGDISIRDAAHLWGLRCAEAATILKDEHRKEKGERISVAAIGEAGEKGVLFANILSERRAYGRGGAGAVMGSKNLKAVVLRGDRKVDIADEPLFKEIVKAARKKIAEHPVVGKGGGFPRVGTMHTVDVTHESGTLPSKNWQENTSDNISAIASEAFEQYIIRPQACFGCPIGCSRETKVSMEGREIITEGPEYETIYAFGAVCDIQDPRVVIAADQLCDDYGLDTISCGGVIGFAMECFEKGLITEKETGGLNLTFGNGDAFLEAIHRIGRRDGIGGILSEGVKRASEKIKGAAPLAVHVKGLELPGYDPRGMKGQGLTYALSDRGGCHLRSNTLRTELLGLPEPIDRYSYENKAEMVRGMQLNVVTYNCLVACFFSTFALTVGDYAEAVSALTGRTLTAQDLLTIAERTWNHSRLFNMREGFRREDDTLPERLFTLPSTKGPSKGQIVEKASFDKMIDAYYELVGWDKKTGIPTDEKLETLGIEERI